MTEPTDLDLRNAAARRIIAERQQAAWDECQRLADQAFGRGWEPSCRRMLVDKEEEARCRKTGERPVPAATVYTAKNAAGERQHFTVENGQPVECPSYEAGFGSMLLEPHPTMRIEVRGEIVAPHRYSLNWAGYDTYQPKSAEALASLRETRERKREERAERKFQEETPLWALMEQEGRGR